MTIQNPPVFIQAGSHPAEDVRRLFHAQMGGRQGVVGSGDLAVTEKSGTPDMSVDVAGGQAFILGDEGTYQGLYFVENRGTTNLAIAAADPTNARKDLVVARVRDSAYSGATDAWELAVVTGTPAAVPAEPSVPDNALVLALVDVPASDTAITNSQITDRRTTQAGQFGRASALGGVVVCTSSTRPTVGVYAGMQAYETDTNLVILYNGSNWVQVTPEAAVVDAFEGTSSLTYTDLATPGPAVTILTGTKAVVHITGHVANTSVQFNLIGFAVSGATTVAADDDFAALITTQSTNGLSGTFLVTGLTPGLNTFTLKYRTGGGTASFQRRNIMVHALP